MQSFKRVEADNSDDYCSVYTCGSQFVRKTRLQRWHEYEDFGCLPIFFGVAIAVPLALFLERKTRAKLTRKVLGLAFICGLLGGSLTQNLYLESVALTTATFVSAMFNLVPAVTFILAVSTGLERPRLGTIAGKVKVLGTLTCIGGAMLLNFYKGKEIKLWSTGINLIKQGQYLHSNNRVGGALTSIGSCISCALWYIVQAKMNETYPSPYSSTALLNVMAAIQSFIFALCMDRDWKEWKLGWNIRLLSAAYAGIISSVVMVVLITWCVQVKGPLYVSIFTPIATILVAILGSLILDEQLTLGSVLGAMLIISGLYAVLWGKAKEMKRMSESMPSDDTPAVEIITSSMDGLLLWS
ncbi:hypothetical protein Nepgr_031035 [Nepenthes gracilis]|uniref:WAT1-related protein n=1 Tax=Nepenthes gracilis TaxID=150966 RepID=A0AAD3TI39_NEPGR|nr:hypothetical protein Nepgr_031035 [Nepenthes gracilis]